MVSAVDWFLGGMQGVGVLEERWFCLWTGGTVLFATFCLAQVLAQPNPRSKVLMLEELPLAVIATQPSSLGDWQSDEPVLVSGKQTLTVGSLRTDVKLSHSYCNIERPHGTIPEGQQFKGRKAGLWRDMLV